MSRDTAGLTLKLRRGAQDSGIHIVFNEDKQDHKNEEHHPNNSRGDGYEEEPGGGETQSFLFEHSATDKHL